MRKRWTPTDIARVIDPMRNCVYGRVPQRTNGKKLRLTIIDKDATRQYERFLVRYPAFPELCEVTPPLDAFVDHAGVFQKIEEWCKERDAIGTVVVCFEDDSRSLSVGLSLLARLRELPVPILVRIESQAGLARLVLSAGSRSDLNGRMRAFGQIAEACSAEVVIQEKLNEFARRIHDDFRTKRKDDEKRTVADFSMAEWEDLDPDLKESNCQQADHIRFKLRAMNCDSRKDPKAPSVSEIADSVVREIVGEEQDKLAEIEHNLWWAERVLSGWKPGTDRNVYKRIHSEMKPWQALNENKKKYDLDAVALIPRLVGLRGEVIFRLPRAVAGDG